jgi:hypothetical protein
MDGAWRRERTGAAGVSAERTYCCYVRAVFFKRLVSSATSTDAGLGVLLSDLLDEFQHCLSGAACLVEDGWRAGCWLRRVYSPMLVAAVQKQTTAPPSP